jgi:hypothetical protein
LGSVVRELVIEPLARLGDILESRIASIKSSLDVGTICKNPEEYEEDVDNWINWLGITFPTSSGSTGTVRLIRERNENLLIPAGTRFTWNGEIVVETTQECVVSKTGGGTHVYKTLVEGEAYSVDIPVTCSTYSGTSIGAGAPLSWPGAPSDVYDVHVESAVSGVSYTSAQEKARLILDILSPDALSGEACIRKALRRNFPNAVMDVVVGDKDPEKPYAVNLYIKPTSCIQNYALKVKFTGGVCKFNGCGIYEILADGGVRDDKGVTYTISSVKYSPKRGTSDSVIEITAQQPITGEFSLDVCGFKEYAMINEWLVAQTKSTPYEFTLNLPAVGVVRANLVLIPGSATTYGIKSAIAELISSSSFNATISDGLLDKTLIKYNAALAKPSMYSITVYSGDIKTLLTTTGTLSQGALRHVVNSPLVLYAQDNLIEVTSA